jgi:uncharacterized membrane protein YdbT with pleckstrin-like domain
MEQESLFKEDEIILVKVRKHFIVYIEDFLLHSFGCILFSLALFFFSTLVPTLHSALSSSTELILLAFLLLFWTSFFYGWTKNYLDVWYVTNQHIITVNQKQLFEREKAFMELARIQDVFFEQNSFLATFLGYGKLRVQSAGTNQEFVIEYVRNVEAVTHRIMDLRDEIHKTGAIALD